MTAQDYGGLDNGRRRVGAVDEDAYDYGDYSYANALPPLEPQPQPAPLPPRRTVERTPVQKNQYSGNNFNRGGGSANYPVGKDACKGRNVKDAAHESSCDLYYDCYEGQGFLQSCPNGLVYNSDSRFGLIGKCDYPHNAICSGRPERSKYFFFIIIMTLHALTHMNH